MATIIRPMAQGDIAKLTRVFAERWKWRSTHRQYQRYWQEHQKGQRVLLLALCDEQIAGYVNILWQAQDEALRAAKIPEINDLVVHTRFRRQGIALTLMQEAEQVVTVRQEPVVGLGCGVSSYYGAAQRLYAKLGYIPDGRGAQKTPWGLVIYMTKQLSASLR